MQRASEHWQDWSPRTDLAVEAHEMARGDADSMPGVVERVEEEDGMRVYRVEVQTEEAEQRLHKRRGNYVTLDVPGLRQRDPELQADVAERFAAELRELLPVGADDLVLVVGLGNEHVTPDALGPLVVERLFVTRHLFHYIPDAVHKGYRPVAAVSPGVLGVTGIETSEIVEGIVEHVQPKLVIAIDALASRSLSRVNATIQIADTGIEPGAGVGNKRRALNKETLGVPVIAIGVPTVVDASTVAHDSLELLLRQLKESVPGNGVNQLFDRFDGEEKRRMLQEVLEPLGDDLVVTPKEIDEFIEDTAQVVAKGLNLALHSAISADEIGMLTHS